MNNKLFVLIFSGCALLQFSASAQFTFQVEEYFSGKPGDTLQLKNMLAEQLEPLVIAYDTVRFRGQLVTRRIENTSTQRLEQWGPKGWLLYTQGIGPGKELVFDAPLVLLPLVVKQGQIIEQTLGYTYLENKQRKGSGTLSYSVKVEGNDSSRTPLQNFADCLVTTTTIIRKSATGPAEGYSIKEWYARGIGLIKAAGEVFVLGPNEKRQSKGRIALMLERAVIKGQLMEKE